MGDHETAVNAKLLKKYVPFCSLSDERLNELASLASIERHGAGVQLFREGDVDNRSLYLLEGRVELQPSNGLDAELIYSDSPDAVYPLADRQPRQVTAVAASQINVLAIDNNVLDYMITWDQLSVMEPPAESPAEPQQDVNLDGRWMNKVLSSLPFRNIPSANMRQLVERMEKVEVKAGETIVNQGESGDYYYLIEEGQARVTRLVDLAELGEGSGFGEEALISEQPRNANVTMLTDGSVLRLSKQDFDALLKEPMLHWLSIGDARDNVNKGAMWLDVRHEKEYEHYRMPNAINIPLHELRHAMRKLEKRQHYVCYCKTGRRSSAAAFLLSQAGYKVSVLRGGLQVLPPLIRLELEKEESLID